ncbi:MAG: hypothetical protein VXZ83_05665 [Verrucomicrobiota bacterium]|nr:hypothetical protein [Verrucomicrobiota bacterium]
MRPINLLPFFTSLGICLLCGCKKEQYLKDLVLPRLMIESRGVDYGGMKGTTVTLPISGTSINIQDQPLVNEFDILNVEMVKVDLGVALLVQVSAQASRELYRGSISNMGGRIVLMVNGNAIGARRIDGAIEDGNYYTFVEVDDEELGKLVFDIKASLVTIIKNK